MTSEEKKIFNGELYNPGDPELVAIKLKAHNLNIDFNKLHEDRKEERDAILKELIGSMGEFTKIQGPITFHYGSHTTIGHHTFINFNFTCQDDGKVTIGNHNDFGPNVTIVTPCHPMVASERLALLSPEGEKKRYCWAKPVTIGDNNWFGANVVVCPGVTIGNNCVIGAGAVVTRDVPDNSFVGGVPAKVIREIGEADSMKYKPEILGDCKVIEE
ncbi:MAG: sugar O-acetyltransferase [Clostridia bacterium]|nr:sugar O-acetyltransferase [Clostridia bacterium]